MNTRQTDKEETDKQKHKVLNLFICLFVYLSTYAFIRGFAPFFLLY